MNLIMTTSNCGLILDRADSAWRNGREVPWHSRSPTDSAGRTGHFVLSRYRVDDDGYVCLTPSLPLIELHGSIDVFRAELESLLERAKRRFSETSRAV